MSFESAQPWPRLPRPGIDPPETPAQRAARRMASGGGVVDRSGPPHGDLSFRSPHERLERWLVGSRPLSLGLDPASPAISITTPSQRVGSSPSRNAPGPARPEFDARVRDLIAELDAHDPGPSASRVPRPWYLIRGLPELFVRLGARAEYLLVGRGALAVHSRGLVLEHLELLTPEPQALLEAASARTLTTTERAALDALDAYACREHVASIGDARQGASVRVLRCPRGRFDALCARRLELTAADPPTLRVLGLSDTLGACLRGEMGLAPIDAHVVLETRELLARWPEGHPAHG